MSSTEREKLIEEANELGLEFAKNTSTKKLKTMVAEANGEPTPVDETPPPSPAVKAEAPAEEEPAQPVNPSAPMSRASNMRERVRLAKQRAFKKRVVTITNKDNRENDVMTTAPLSFENQYFGLAKNVPLDIPVELEQGLIDVAETTMMTLHRDEIIDGKRTGNKVPQRVKKYAVSYAKS